MCHENSDCEGPLIDDNEDIDDDILLLTENDIPGASLDGKDPTVLNVTQLKRWLVCRGAPVNGKKPELIKRLVYYNIIIMYFYLYILILEFVITLSMVGMDSWLTQMVVQMYSTSYKQQLQKERILLMPSCLSRFLDRAIHSGQSNCTRHQRSPLVLSTDF